MVYNTDFVVRLFVGGRVCGVGAVVDVVHGHVAHAAGGAGAAPAVVVGASSEGSGHF